MPVFVEKSLSYLSEWQQPIWTYNHLVCKQTLNHLATLNQFG